MSLGPPGAAPLGRLANRRLALAVLLGAGAMGCAVGLAATSAWLISRSAQRPQESAIAIAIVGVQFFALGRGLLRYCERLAGHDAALRVLARVQVQLYERLERLAPAGLPEFRNGELLARLVHDVDALQSLLVRVIPPFAIAALVGAITVALLGAMLPAAALVLLICLLLAATLVPWASGRLAARSAARQAHARGELTAEVVDVLAGAPELTVDGSIELALARVQALDAELTEIARAQARTAGLGQGLVTALMGLAMWASLALGVAAVADGRLDGVLLAALALVPLVASELVAPLPSATRALQQVRRSRARLDEVMRSATPLLDPPQHARLPASGTRTIAVRELRCRYPGQRDWALDGVDLDLPAGARVALVGASGAGKTTLAWALLRFLPYASGSITIDGVELADLDGAQVRGEIAMVDQDAHLFDSTVEANLRLARPDATELQLLYALARARLLEWVQTLPAGLATEVGEHGARVSGGQRQRIALARALLADRPVLILDEPGEHLDAQTARAILDDLLAAAGGRSTLLITHRLARLEDFDEIVVLHAGRVVERGTHDDLLARGGRYAALWVEQMASAS